MDAHIPVSRHACRRTSQRGIAQEVLACVFDHGDLETPSRGCTRLRLSARKAQELILSEVLHHARVRKAERLTLIVADNEKVVTAYWSSAHVTCRARRDRRHFARAA